MDTHDFAAWFRKQLKRRQWVQADFHHKSGVPRSTVSAWYRGVRVPDPPLCDVVAETFGVAVDDVLVIAGHRPRLDAIAPDDPRRELMALAERIAPAKLDAALRVLRGLHESKTGWT